MACMSVVCLYVGSVFHFDYEACRVFMNIIRVQFPKSTMTSAVKPTTFVNIRADESCKLIAGCKVRLECFFLTPDRNMAAALMTEINNELKEL